MKALKDDIDMLGFVTDAECGIRTRCPCGGGENHQRVVTGSEEEVLMLRKRVDVMAAEIAKLKYKLTRPNPTSP
ncbi:unnamed protein product [Brassica rapa]|uniref:Uncharacterized protein n=1 Tax=Brassica campestris TaxID=3711 RepID=A0A8D9M4F4_BRACM|nr:unnamed protein product [Brassica rapa]